MQWKPPQQKAHHNFSIETKKILPHPGLINKVKILAWAKCNRLRDWAHFFPHSAAPGRNHGQVRDLHRLHLCLKLLTCHRPMQTCRTSRTSPYTTDYRLWVVDHAVLQAIPPQQTQTLYYVRPHHCIAVQKRNQLRHYRLTQVQPRLNGHPTKTTQCKNHEITHLI